MENTNQTSPYQLLMWWIKDGNKSSPVPQVIQDAPNCISPIMVLSYYQTNAMFFPFWERTLNNFGLFQVSIIDLIKMLKDSYHRCGGFKQPYIEKSKSVKNGLFYQDMRKKYPFLKSYDTTMLIEYIDKRPDKDSIYETFGYNIGKVKKQTAADKKAFSKKATKMTEPSTGLKFDL